MLQRPDELRRARDRVHGGVGEPGMPAAPGDRDLEEVRRRHPVTGHGRDLPVRQRRPQMAAVDEVHALHHARVDQLPRPAGRELLAVLEDEPHLARGHAAGHQLGRRAEQHRRVPVVPARVHRARPLGRELDAALLGDRQRVDVRAQRHDAAGLRTAQPPEHARLGRARHLHAELGRASARRTPTSRAPRMTPRDGGAGGAAMRSLARWVGLTHANTTSNDRARRRAVHRRGRGRDGRRRRPSQGQDQEGDRDARRRQRQKLG